MFAEAVAGNKDETRSAINLVVNQRNNTIWEIYYYS